MKDTTNTGANCTRTTAGDLNICGSDSMPFAESNLSLILPVNNAIAHDFNYTNENSKLSLCTSAAMHDPPCFYGRPLRTAGSLS